MELLSPAGSYDSLVMAVQNGADAVYAGGNMFSARRSAVNFDMAELRQAVDYCHLRGVKLYLAVNTLIKEFELADLCRYLETVYRLGIDAVIVQDMGVLRLVRKYLPDLPVNGSTQMTVCSSAGVRELERLGVRRVVLARELSAKEIAAIRRETKAELEIFVHGALCMSYSGQCLMSSMIGGRSGNRGACAQPCRLSYTLLENGRQIGKTLPLLSPKDLCLAERMAEVKASDADSLKIEGRMKSPEYVGMVTRVYRMALDGNLNHQDVEEMLRFFSRGGSSTGYFDGKKFRAMMDYDGGAKISADRTMEKEIHSTVRGEIRKRPVSMEFFAEAGKPVRLSVRCGDCAAEIAGETAELARNRPAEEERVRAQLAKLGETPFRLEKAHIFVDGRAAVSISEINALRRQAAEKLERDFSESFRREERKVNLPDLQPLKPEKRKTVLCAQVWNQEQYRAVKTMGIDEIYVPYDLFRTGEYPDSVCVLPELPRQGEKLDLSKAELVMVNHLGQFEQARGKEILGGHRLNVLNREAAEQYADLGVRSLTVSPELNAKEIRQLAASCSLPLEIIGYGRIPLMTMENCVIKSAYRCACKEKSFSLRDRKDAEFPILTQDCRNILLNSCPIYMADRMADIKNLQIDRVRLLFTVENPEMCCIIIKEYQKALAGEEISPPQFEYTHGHFYRGVL